MKNELSYVLVTPYTISKSRTGGVVARLLSRSSLELVGAQIFLPDEKFAQGYAEMLRKRSPDDSVALLADYVQQNIAPSDRPHRSLLLLFRGENPCEKLTAVCGNMYTQHVKVHALQGETVRDTYADLIFSENNPEKVKYFEPAVLTPGSQEEANEDLQFIANFLDNKENIVKNITHPDPSVIEQTLVIIKPDNWANSSARPGSVIDMFSRTGLRIVGIKVHHFSLAEAMEFYGPVEAILQKKLAPVFGRKAKELLEEKFNLTLNEETATALNASFGAEYAKDQFAQIVEFMCGKRPGDCSGGEADKPGSVKCMILIYEGENAVAKIRDVLGATNPDEALEGTIRREFGSNVMVNTAHASDSAESFIREKGIVKADKNSFASIAKQALN